MKIQLIAYNPIDNLTSNEAEIIISSEVFDGINYQSGKSVLSFTNCRFKKLIIQNDADIDFKEIIISFSYCQIQNFEIKSIVTKKIGLSFHGCLINGNINNENLKYIGLNNCITPSLFLQKQDKINISFTEENLFVRNWIKLLKATDIKSVDDLLNLKQSLIINHSKEISINFNHSKSEKKGIYRDKFSQNPDWEIRYILHPKQKEKLNINISIDFSNQEDIQLKVGECILNSLSFTGTANGSVNIENTVINNFFIRSFSSKSESLFYNIYPNTSDSKFEVHKSNMDNCWFDNIDFNGYKSLSFYRTRFAKASFTSCNFPNDNLSFEKFKVLENIHYPEKKSQNYYKDQYETFLQLKKSLENSGNYHEAQKLGAISKESLRKISSLSEWDKFILWLNAKSNNHGMSIKRATLGLLFFSVLFYILYLLSINRIFNSNEIDWTLVGNYFSFLDITHRNDFLVTKNEFNFWTLIIDFTHKIVAGFFIYQFITAFRKYGKI